MRLGNLKCTCTICPPGGAFLSRHDHAIHQELESVRQTRWRDHRAAQSSGSDEDDEDPQDLFDHGGDFVGLDSDPESISDESSDESMDDQFDASEEDDFPEDMSEADDDSSDGESIFDGEDVYKNDFKLFWEQVFCEPEDDAKYCDPKADEARNYLFQKICNLVCVPVCGS